MELMAAISALEALKKPCTVDLYTDSQYASGHTGGSMAGRRTDGAPRTKKKKRFKNVDLGKRLDAAWKTNPACAGHGSRATRPRTRTKRADKLAREGGRHGRD